VKRCVWEDEGGRGRGRASGQDAICIYVFEKYLKRLLRDIKIVYLGKAWKSAWAKLFIQIFMKYEIRKVLEQGQHKPSNK
jgi:hypothetical protein